MEKTSLFFNYHTNLEDVDVKFLWEAHFGFFQTSTDLLSFTSPSI